MVLSPQENSVFSSRRRSGACTRKDEVLKAYAQSVCKEYLGRVDILDIRRSRRFCQWHWHEGEENALQTYLILGISDKEAIDTAPGPLSISLVVSEPCSTEHVARIYNKRLPVIYRCITPARAGRICNRPRFLQAAVNRSEL